MNDDIQPPIEEKLDLIDQSYDPPNVTKHVKAIEILEVKHKLSSQKVILDKVINVFVFSNIFILIVVVLFYCVDSLLIYTESITATDRIVSTSVLITLIGATGVQLGAVFVSVSKFIFK